MVYGERCVAESIPGKTEAAIFGMRQRLVGLEITGGVNVAGSTMQFSDTLKLLGVTLDASLLFDKHVTHVPALSTPPRYDTFILCSPCRWLKQLLCPLWGADSTTVISVARLSGTLIDFSVCKILWRTLFSKVFGQPVHSDLLTGITLAAYKTACSIQVGGSHFRG